MESPAPLGCYSEVTLDSQQRQVSFASISAPRARLTPANSHKNLDQRHGSTDLPTDQRHHSVSFASTGAVYDSISKLSNLTISCTNNRSIIEEEYSNQQINNEVNEEPANNNAFYNDEQKFLVPSNLQNSAKTPDTPPPNVSPGDSSKNSQTFSSHFVSMTSLERGTSDDNYSLQKRYAGNSETPSSPSAILTPSTTDYVSGPYRHDFGEDCHIDDPELWDSDGLCRWESFEADLALADLNLDPCFKTDVEENIYFRDDFFSSRRLSKARGRNHPSHSLDL